MDAAAVRRNCITLANFESFPSRFLVLYGPFLYGGPVLRPFTAFLACAALHRTSLYHNQNELFKRTGVLPERQKLIGLKCKNKQPATDEVKLESLELKPNSKVMMIGSKEKDIKSVNDEELLASNQNVVNDLDLPDDVEISVEQCSENLAKIERRIKEYKVHILNPPRAGKKLLVLDIDYTLFDHRSVAENALQLMRPYLHEFLTEAYKNYDIIIWSATSMKWISVSGSFAADRFRLKMLLIRTNVTSSLSPLACLGENARARRGEEPEL